MVTRLYDFVDGTVAKADEVDAELNQLVSELNSNVILTTGAQTKAGVLTLSSAPVIAAITNTGTLTLPTSTDTLVGKATTDTLTNKRITKREVTTTSSVNPTPASDITDIYTITALAAAATFGAPTGTPTQGQTLLIRIKDDSWGPWALSWNAIYRAGTDIAKPTTTVTGKTMYVGFIYSTTDTKWDLIMVVDGI